MLNFKPVASSIDVVFQNLHLQISSLTDEREKMVNRQHELEAAVIELQRKIGLYVNFETKCE